MVHELLYKKHVLSYTRSSFGIRIIIHCHKLYSFTLNQHCTCISGVTLLETTGLIIKSGISGTGDQSVTFPNRLNTS
jgi:hypothetical protein